MTTPSANALLRGTVTLAFEATDNVRVARVEFLRDTTVLGADSSAPYSIAWNTTAITSATSLITARVVDTAGNTITTAAHRVAIDNIAPQTAIIDEPARTTNSATATFTFIVDEPGATFECRLDGTVFAACVSPRTYTNLTSQTHVFQVRSRDRAGNLDVSPASWSWTVDRQRPETTISAAPRDPTSSRTATFDYAASETSARFECSLDDAAFSTCAATGQAYTNLVDGTHQFEVRAIDASGNADDTPAVWTWTVDTAPPETTLRAGPADVVNDAEATFAFASTEAESTFQCSLDGTAYQPCTSPKTYTGLSAGQHVFRVQGRDEAGNLDVTAVVRSWMVDFVAPQVRLLAPGDSAHVRANVTLAADAMDSAGSERVEFLVDVDMVGADQTAPYTVVWDSGDIALGTATISARAVDRAGNITTSGSRTVGVDNTPPETTITGGPRGTVNSPTASFSFTSNEHGATFLCRLDSAAYTPCTSPQTYRGLAGGTHIFRVYSRDQAGNVDASMAARSWTIDLTLPSVSLTGPTVGAIVRSSVVLSASASDNSGVTRVEFHVNNILVGQDTTAPYSVAWDSRSIESGTATITARAVDVAGNMTPSASRRVTVDNVLPDSTITAGPTGTVNSTTASFTFAASESGASFACSVDGGTYTACTSPKSYTGLAVGTHVFRVRARDAAGNVDVTPATRSWTIASSAVGAGAMPGGSSDAQP